MTRETRVKVICSILLVLFFVLALLLGLLNQIFKSEILGIFSIIFLSLGFLNLIIPVEMMEGIVGNFLSDEKSGDNKDD